MDQSRDLDRIVSELNARPETDGDEASDTAPLDRWLAALLAKGGSDLLLVPGAPVCILHEGGVRNIEAEPLSGSEIEAIVLPALTPHALKQYRAGQIAAQAFAARASWLSLSGAVAARRPRRDECRRHIDSRTCAPQLASWHCLR